MRETARSRREAGALENEIVAALAAASEPRTPSQVQADLGRDLAYTTVMTTLARLHAKGVVHRERSGRAFAYSLAQTPDAVPAALTARRMRRLLDEVGDRAGVLARFVGELGPEDERMLAGLLRDEPGSDVR